MSSYYDVPNLSMRAAVAPYIRNNITGFQVDTVEICITINYDKLSGYDKEICDKNAQRFRERGGNLATINPHAQLYRGEDTAPGSASSPASTD